MTAAPTGTPPGESAGRRWTITAGGYTATFGFPSRGGRSDGSLSCLSLTRSGDELLVPPGAPLVSPWLGRLSARSFEVAGARMSLDDDDRVTVDGHGRPLHGLRLDPAQWEASVVSGASGASDTLSASAEVPASPAFPFAHRLSVDAVVGGDGLVLRTTVTSHDGVVPVALGWHPYLRAPGVTSEGTGVEVDLPFVVSCDLEDLLPTGGERTVAPGVRTDPVMDDHWRASPGDMAVVRSGDFEVTLVIDDGYGWAMTWVPHRGAGFVCVEPMAGPLDPFRPGAPTPLATPDRPWVGEFTLR